MKADKTGRRAALERSTAETQVRLSLNLDGTGQADIDTGVGFLDHMLTLLASHSARIHHVHVARDAINRVAIGTLLGQ